MVAPVLRSRRWHAAFIGFGLAVLAGCGPAASGAPPAGTAFDGTYAGRSTLLRGFGYLCGPPSYELAVSVKDGRFAYTPQLNPYGNTPVEARIAADGTVKGSGLYFAPNYVFRGPEFRYAWITIAGHVAGPVLDITISDLRCDRRWTLQRG